MIKMTNESKRGRPTRYSDEELKTVLYNFSKKHTGPLNYSLLEKNTKIPRHVWMRRMKETINDLNSMICCSTTEAVENLPLPNISKIIEEYKDKPNILSEKLYNWNEIIQTLHEKVYQYEKQLAVVETFQKKIKHQEKIIKQQKETIDYYESIILDSTNPLYRRESQLDYNIISIHPNNKDKASSFDFKKQFPALFTE